MRNEKSEICNPKSVLAFRLFDTDVVVEADDPAVTALFARAYARFRVSEPRPDAVRYRVRSSGELVLDGQVHRVEAPDLLADYAYTRIINDALGRVRSHFLIHAAALSRDGRGLLIAGPSGHGKTTLTLALVRRGFAFLSDDIAALGRADGWLYPFPRAFNVRGGGGPADVEGLGGVLGEPCAACVLVELSAGQPGPKGGWLWATVDRTTDDPSTPIALPAAQSASGQALLAALRELEGVGEVRARRVGRFVEVALQTSSGAGVEAALEAACRERGVLLFDVRRQPARAPDFDRVPQLAPLTAREAALALMRHLRGGARSALVQEMGGPAGLFLALAGLAAEMRCYRLTVGRLAEMVKAVCDLVWPESPNGPASTPQPRPG